MRFAILQEDFRDIPFLVMKQILIEDGQVPATDAARMARNNRGILTEQLDAKQAAAVCQRLRQGGVPVRLMPSGDLPKLKKGRTTRWIGMQDDELLVPVGVMEETISVPYSAVFVISSAQITIPANREGVGTRDRSEKSLFASPDSTPAPLAHFTELIVYSASLGLMQLRLPAAELQFTRILGPTTGQTRFQKYLSLLELLVEKCPAAVVSPYTETLLRERKQHYESSLGPWQEDRGERQFQQTNRWLLQLALIRETESPLDEA